MSSFHIRPRFEQVVSGEPEKVQAQIIAEVETERFEVKNHPGFVSLRIHEQDRHFWSPRLTMGIEPAEPGRTVIRGVYGPNAHVWSLFILSYLVVGFLATIAGVLALCQWKIGVPVWGFWPFLACMVVLVVIYAIAQFGQKLGAQQTFQIHQAFETALHRSVTVH